MPGVQTVAGYEVCKEQICSVGFTQEQNGCPDCF